MHGAFLVVAKDSGDGADGEQKMAKSEGNFLRLQTLLDRGYDPLRIVSCASRRITGLTKFTMGVHGRGCVGLQQAQDFAARARQIGGPESDWVTDIRKRFSDAVSDDLNMPQAMAAVSDLISEADRRNDYGVSEALYDFDRILGLRLRESAERATAADSYVESLIKQRDEARAVKDWATADQIRKQLSEQGITIEDTPSGTLWRKIDSGEPEACQAEAE